MVAHDNPILLKQELGRRLRAAREANGLSLIEAATRLEIARSTMSRIENGQAAVSVHLVRSMLDLYDVYDEDLLDVVRRARQPGWWKAHGISNKDFIALESGANRVSCFHPDLVYGLLQTADYARAVFTAGMRRQLNETWLDNQLDVRLIRQERLVDPDEPLKLTAVIGEFALYRQVGGAAVMRAQLRHLALATELPTVDLRILPASTLAVDAVYGPFTILDFPREHQASIVHLQSVLGNEVRDREHQVATARMKFDRIRSLALGAQESVDLIERVAAERLSEE
jgi:transcriptional regulator with XRE-family HTH domain